MVDQWVTVCGTVAAATYAIDSTGSPTFLSLERPYPDQVLTLVIWGDDRWWYAEAPEELFVTGTHVCAEGLVELYKGQPQVVPITPITLLTDWISASGDIDIDCEGIDDPYYAEICWDILADYREWQDELWQDAMDDYYDDLYYYGDDDDYYYPEP